MPGGGVIGGNGAAGGGSDGDVATPQTALGKEDFGGEGSSGAGAGAGGDVVVRLTNSDWPSLR
jgi:hypothetical protein